MKGFFEKVYTIVRTIPRGKVATYGQIARLAGSPHAARMVGWAMSSSTPADRVPWHRVVGAGGNLIITKAPHYIQIQKQLLQQEGVLFRGLRAEMSVCRWQRGLPSRTTKVSGRKSARRKK